MSLFYFSSHGTLSLLRVKTKGHEYGHLIKPYELTERKFKFKPWSAFCSKFGDSLGSNFYKFSLKNLCCWSLV